MRTGRLIKTGLAGILRLTGSKPLLNRWKNGCAAFAFHRISDPADESVFASATQSIPLELFDSFVELIAHDYHPLSYEQFEKHILARKPFPPRSCMITFDDGWRDNYTLAWPVLKKHGLPALIFLPTSYIGTPRRFWQDELYAAFRLLRERRRNDAFFFEAHILSDIVFDLLEDKDDRVWYYTREAVDRLKGLDNEFADRALHAVLDYVYNNSQTRPTGRSFLNAEEVTEMSRNGIYFGSHAVNHRILPGIPDDELTLEIETSRRQVAELTGHETTAFSYPNGDYDQRVAERVCQAGYHTGFTITYGTVDPQADPYTLRRIDMNAEMLSHGDGRFSRSLFAIETTPMMLSLKRRRQHPLGPAPAGRSGKIKLLFLIDEMQGEAGTEMQVVNLLRQLPSEQFELYLACFVVSDWLRSLNLPCRIYELQVPSFRRPTAYLNILRFSHFLRREKIDIVQTFFPAAHVVGVTAAFLARVPRIITSRRNFGHALTVLQKWTMSIINRLTHRIMANSFSVKQQTQKLEGAGPRQINVIYNGVDTTAFDSTAETAELTKADLGFAPEEPLVGLVANLRPVKGVEYFIRAAGLVARERPDAGFVILGFGELIDDLRKLTEECAIADRVRFVGRTPKVISYLRLFDVAALTSLSEGFSNSILEYMAAGLPVIATNVGSNWEAVEEGVTGYLVRPKDPKDIAEKLLLLLNNPELAHTMGEAGRTRVQRDFTMPGMIERYDEYYRHVLTTPYREPRYQL